MNPLHMLAKFDLGFRKLMAMTPAWDQAMTPAKSLVLHYRTQTPVLRGDDQIEPMLCATLEEVEAALRAEYLIDGMKIEEFRATQIGSRRYLITLTFPYVGAANQLLQWDEPR